MMRRLGRWGSPWLFGVALGLGLAVGAGLAARSYYAGDVLRHTRNDAAGRRSTAATLWSSRGRLGFEWYRLTFDTSAAFEDYAANYAAAAGRHGWLAEARPAWRDAPAATPTGWLGFAAESRHVAGLRYTHPAAGGRGAAPPAPLGVLTWDSLHVTLPHWFAGLVLASPALPVALRWRRQRLRRWRRARGCCPHCGYDLRASKDRCPECGTPIPKKPATAPS